MNETLINLNIFNKNTKELIGHGSFANVYKVEKLGTGKIFAAKVLNEEFNYVQDLSSDEKEKVTNLIREINLLSFLDHPSIIKLIGISKTDFDNRPKPTIITSYEPNGSLNSIISKPSSEWTPTKKLINIYGIASGLSFLHLHEILHRDMKPDNILMDENLFPKISDFGLAKITSFISETINNPSKNDFKGTPIYSAPEIFKTQSYSKKSDIYAFAIITYQILTGKNPFQNMLFFDIINRIMLGNFPVIPDVVPLAYKDLINRCLSLDPESRPDASDIVKELKENKEYITEEINEGEFLDYVYYIDNYKASFDHSHLIHYKELIHKECNEEETEENPLERESPHEAKLKKVPTIPKTPQKVQHYQEQQYKASIRKVLSDNDIHLHAISPRSLLNKKRKDTICLFPLDELHKLSEECQNLVQNAKTDPEVQYNIGKDLIEGKNGFSQNIEIGVKYLKASISNKCVDALIYYSQMLVDGILVLENLKEAKNYLKYCKDSRALLLLGKIYEKEKDFSVSFKKYKQSSDEGNVEAMYKCGTMLLRGLGCTSDIEKGIEMLKVSSRNKFHESEVFLQVYEQLKKLPGFNELDGPGQFFFTQKIILNEDGSMNQINVLPIETEKLFKKNFLDSQDFINFMRNFESINFQLNYSSTKFNSIYLALSKIKKEQVNHIEIIVDISSPVENDSFKDYPLVSQIIISEIASIGKGLFRDCINLKEVSIPPSVTTILDNAFDGCKSLSSITIPSTVTSIGSFAFHKCSSLIEITIPDSVVDIHPNAFSGCSSLKNIKCLSTDKITCIPDFAFEGCSSLEEFQIPLSAIYIGNDSFAGCYSLKEIVITRFVTYIGNNAFSHCHSLTNVIIPYSVNHIGENAFSKCLSLTSIEIPNSVIFLGSNAFEGCSKLSEVFIIDRLSSSERSRSKQLILKLDGQSLKPDKSLNSKRSVSMRIENINSLKEINKSSFRNCTSLRQFNIPYSVKKIKDYSFYNCTSLLEPLFSPLLTHIGEYSFYMCSSLTHLTFPSSLEEIKKHAFDECTSIIQISIPMTIRLIDEYAFCRCTSIKEVKFEASIFPSEKVPPNIVIGQHVFDKCSALKNIQIPPFVAHIESCLFTRCILLTEIEIPSSVKTIERCAFFGCSSLTKIKFPSSLESIGSYAFQECTSLVELSIPSSVSKIGIRCFCKCSSLARVEFLSSEIIFDLEVFKNCDSLKQVTILSSLELDLENIGIRPDDSFKLLKI